MSVSQGLVVQIGEEDYNDLINNYSDDELLKASHVARVYWLVGEGPCGKPVFKNPANENLMFYMEGDQPGWYIASEYFESFKEKQKKPDSVYSWLGPEDPNFVHVPYWEKKALKAGGSGVKTIVQFHTDRIFYIL